jgi:hypothetical protein
MDRSLKPRPWEVADPGSGPLGIAGDALREAGAIDVVFSPRHLGPLIKLGRRHAASVLRRHVSNDIELSFTVRAWAALPWQAG